MNRFRLFLQHFRLDLELFKALRLSLGMFLIALVLAFCGVLGVRKQSSQERELVLRAKAKAKIFGRQYEAIMVNNWKKRRNAR